ncbi:MAG: hypothetical protein NDJ89_16490 [Oligoflexia bacterium]|nr:hypothetical protein [Oligoflexia bacterium]
MSFGSRTGILMAAALAGGLCAVPASGGIEVGNGGQGVVLGDRLFLLDLVESGMESSVFIDSSAEADSVIDGIFRDRLTAAFRELEDLPLALVLRKFEEIRRIDEPLSFALLLAAEKLRWAPVETELEAIPDRAGVVAVSRYEVVQLAVRAGRSVRVYLPGWRRLDPSNRAALLVHELVYALMKPNRRSDGFSEQEGIRAREITAYLFSSDLGRGGLSGLHAVISGEIAVEAPGAKLSGERLEERRVLVTMKVPVNSGEFLVESSYAAGQPFDAWISGQCTEMRGIASRRARSVPIQISIGLAWFSRGLIWQSWTSPRGAQSGLQLDERGPLTLLKRTDKKTYFFISPEEAENCENLISAGLDGLFAAD